LKNLWAGNSNITATMRKHLHHGGNAVYVLGIIGAAVYFISNAATFWAGVLGLLKALVWPAFLVYYAFQFLIK
jgi:hypothetical protein